MENSKMTTMQAPFFKNKLITYYFILNFFVGYI